MKFYWIQMKSQLSWPKEPRALNSLNLDFQLSPDLSSSCFFFFLREIALVWKEIKFYEWPYADKSRVKWCHFHWLTPMTSAFPQTFSMNRNMLRCGLCTCPESNLNHFSWQFYKSCLISPNYRGDSARIPISTSLSQYPQPTMAKGLHYLPVGLHEFDLLIFEYNRIHQLIFYLFSWWEWHKSKF